MDWITIEDYLMGSLPDQNPMTGTTTWGEQASYQAMRSLLGRAGGLVHAEHRCTLCNQAIQLQGHSFNYTLELIANIVLLQITLVMIFLLLNKIIFFPSLKFFLIPGGIVLLDLSAYSAQIEFLNSNGKCLFI